MRPFPFSSLRRTLGTAALLGLFALPAAHAQTFFVSSFVSNTVVKVAPGGTISTLDSNEPGANGMAFDAQGNLFVSAEKANEVDKYTPQGVKSVVATGFHSPIGLAFGADGSLFVADNGTQTIVKIAPGGGQSVYASLASIPDNYPYALAFDRQGNLFVSLNDLIEKITPGGTVSTFASGFVGLGAIAFNSAGTLFVADNGGEIDGDGVIDSFTPGGVKSVFASGLDFPVGLAFDSAGSLYSTQLDDGTLTRYTAAGVPTLVASGLSEPTFIAIQPLAAAPEPSPFVAFGVGLVSLGALSVRAKKRTA